MKQPVNSMKRSVFERLLGNHQVGFGIRLDYGDVDELIRVFGPEIRLQAEHRRHERERAAQPRTARRAISSEELLRRTDGADGAVAPEGSGRHT